MKTHTAWEVDGVAQLVTAEDHAEAAVELVRSQPAPVGSVTRLVNVMAGDGELPQERQMFLVTGIGDDLRAHRYDPEGLRAARADFAASEACLAAILKVWDRVGEYHQNFADFHVRGLRDAIEEARAGRKVAGCP